MGFFKKDAGAQAQSAQQMAQQAMEMQRQMGIDTANFGGPSNAPVADDDPIFDPVEGITLQHYGWIAKLGTNAGVTDEAGMAAIAEQNGLDGPTFLRAVKVWTERMGQNMAVGQKFRQYYDAY